MQRWYNLDEVPADWARAGGSVVTIGFFDGEHLGHRRVIRRAVERAAEDYRGWVRSLLTELAAQAGVTEPEDLARQLHLLYDGSGQSARMDHDPAVAAVARAAAAVLLDTTLAGQTASRLDA